MFSEEKRQISGTSKRHARKSRKRVDHQKDADFDPRQHICIPRGAVHRFDNCGTEEAKQLSIVTPAVMGPAYFREARAAIDAAPGRPPEMTKMLEIFRRHGMTIAALPPVPGPQA